MKSQVILVIDDDPYIRKMLRIILSSENFTVVEAEDAKTAFIEMDKQLPDLIVQDLNLPDMDCFELNRRLLAYNPKMPIIAFTGVMVKLSDRENYRGFASFLLKPVEPTNLVKTIKSSLLKNDNP